MLAAARAGKSRRDQRERNRKRLNICDLLVRADDQNGLRVKPTYVSDG
jgi:hypothetical protein